MASLRQKLVDQIFNDGMWEDNAKTVVQILIDKCEGYDTRQSPADEDGDYAGLFANDVFQDAYRQNGVDPDRSHIHWDSEDGYPTQLFDILYYQARKIALAWIDANKPNAWYREMFV